MGGRLHPGRVRPLPRDGATFGPGRLGRVRLLRQPFPVLLGLRLHLLCTLHGLPVGFAVTGATADERQTLLAILDTDPTLTGADRSGQTLIADKSYYGRGFEPTLAEAGVDLLRPPARAKHPGLAASSSSRSARSLSRSTTRSMDSSIWNSTAATPRPECGSALRNTSWPWPPRSATTTAPASRSNGRYWPTTTAPSESFI